MNMQVNVLLLKMRIDFSSLSFDTDCPVHSDRKTLKRLHYTPAANTPFSIRFVCVCLQCHRWQSHLKLVRQTEVPDNDPFAMLNEIRYDDIIQS